MYLFVTVVELENLLDVQPHYSDIMKDLSGPLQTMGHAFWLAGS